MDAQKIVVVRGKEVNLEKGIEVDRNLHQEKKAEHQSLQERKRRKDVITANIFRFISQ